MDVPAKEKDVVSYRLFPRAKASAMRPPVPFGAVPLTWQSSVCAPFCWSECENKPEQRWVLPKWPLSLIGAARLPTLAMNAAWPLPYKLLRNGKRRWTPKFLQGWPVVENWRSSPCGKARSVRIALYSWYRLQSGQGTIMLKVSAPPAKNSITTAL